MPFIFAHSGWKHRAAPPCHALTSQHCTSCTQSLPIGSVFPHLGCHVVPKTRQQCPAFLRSAPLNSPVHLELSVSAGGKCRKCASCTAFVIGQRSFPSLCTYRAQLQEHAGSILFVLKENCPIRTFLRYLTPLLCGTSIWPGRRILDGQPWFWGLCISGVAELPALLVCAAPQFLPRCTWESCSPLLLHYLPTFSPHTVQPPDM